MLERTASRMPWMRAGSEGGFVRRRGGETPHPDRKAFAMHPGPSRSLPVLGAVSLSAVVGLVLAPAGGTPRPEDALPASGAELYRVACASCHGAGGRGAPSGMTDIDVPFPDFTDCNFASREAEADWVSVVKEGGPARGFSEHMPAFGDALSDSQILAILAHVRTLADCDSWPRGELNLPKPLFTTKAFPEDELVLSAFVRTDGPDSILNKLVYERRIGAANQIEIVVPFGWGKVEDAGGREEWTSSVGDLTLAVKRVLFHRLSWGSIVSAGAEVVLPTGDEDEGFGDGTVAFEPYLAYGQLLPADFFLQVQGGAKIPVNDDRIQDEVFWRGVFGRTFSLGRYGRSVSPMVEILGSENVARSGGTEWDVVPEVQISLSARQHVRICFGARIPLNRREDQAPAYAAYLLWDVFDGGFFEGW